MYFVLKFELILIIGSNKVLTESARKVYRGRRVGQGCCTPMNRPAAYYKPQGALSYKPEIRGFEIQGREWIFPIYLILQAALDPGVYSACNRNEDQKQKNNISGE
jgi:hypothetical protein